jgi:hypothetical protein
VTMRAATTGCMAPPKKRGADLSGRASNRRTSGAVATPVHLISNSGRLVRAF